MSGRNWVDADLLIHLGGEQLVAACLKRCRDTVDSSEVEDWIAVDRCIFARNTFVLASLGKYKPVVWEQAEGILLITLEAKVCLYSDVHGRANNKVNSLTVSGQIAERNARIKLCDRMRWSLGHHGSAPSILRQLQVHLTRYLSVVVLDVCVELLQEHCAQNDWFWIGV